MASSAPSRIKRIAANLFLIVVGALLPLAVFEFGARYLPNSMLPPSMRDAIADMEIRSREVYIPDPKLGYIMKPGLDYYYQRDELSFHMTTPLNLSGAGFRGGTRGGDAWGVAVGDSFTFGAGVDRESAWPARLAQLSGREVINLGVSGYGPQQYTGNLAKYGLGLHPRIVFYCIFNNDVRDALAFENRFKERRRGFSLKDFLRENLVSYNLGYAIVSNRRQDDKYIRLENVGLALSVRKLKEEILEDSARLRKAWPVIEREVDHAAERSAAAGAAFVLLYFPSKEEVYWDLVKEQAEGMSELDDRYDQLRKSILGLCGARRMRCLDLSPTLKEAAKRREKLYFSIDSHWNKRGHELVAQAIYRFLLTEPQLLS